MTFLNGVQIPEPAEGWIYLDAVALIKCIDPDGNTRYKETRSRGITEVEALGMAETYTDTLRQALLRKARNDDAT